jgi:hypothetical protein
MGIPLVIRFLILLAFTEHLTNSYNLFRYSSYIASFGMFISPA